MAEKQVDRVAQGEAGAASLARLRVDKESSFVPEKVTREAKQAEPQMRALVRILGAGVLDVLPEPLRSAVDASYAFWQANPDSYQRTPFDSEQDKDDALTVMRAYAEAAGTEGYTIRTLTDPDPLVLIWRAQNRRTVKPKA